MHARARRCELLQRTRSVIHRRGDSFSSLRSDEGHDAEPDQAPGPRPIFFIHGVGLGLVRCRAFSQYASTLPHRLGVTERPRAAAVTEAGNDPATQNAEGQGKVC